MKNSVKNACCGDVVEAADWWVNGPRSVAADRLLLRVGVEVELEAEFGEI